MRPKRNVLRLSDPDRLSKSDLRLSIMINLLDGMEECFVEVHQTLDRNIL
jgi:hypothetical protein